MWTYNQSNGSLIKDGKLVATGYSGFGKGKNNPPFARLVNQGPIPVGFYTIGRVFNSEHLGPFVMSLEPSETTKTFGRGGFFIHGDSTEHPGNASHGCIILDKTTRELISSSLDNELEVV